MFNFNKFIIIYSVFNKVLATNLNKILLFLANVNNKYYAGLINIYKDKILSKIFKIRAIGFYTKNFSIGQVQISSIYYETFIFISQILRQITYVLIFISSKLEDISLSIFTSYYGKNDDNLLDQLVLLLFTKNQRFALN